MIRHPRDCPIPRIPVIASDWQPLFKPVSAGCYVNDHCLVRADDGQWHLFGITGPQKSDPEKEVRFAHGVGEKLWSTTLFTERNPVCDDGNRCWAPTIGRIGPRYVMLYGPSPTKGAVSRDLDHWMGQAITLLGAPPECHRDHMILPLDDETWLMYCTALDDEGHGAIAVFVSNDLIEWRYVRMALRTLGAAALNPAWGATESPFVVKIDDWYYLSLTYTDCKKENYHQTLVFRSLNPFDFGVYDADRPEESVLQRLQAHAPELIRDPADGNWYITTCGWNGFGIPHEGAVSIAKLEWREDRG
jgi:beta-fructofuranosidase